MPETNNQYVYFSITDSFDPADITAQVGVEPTECGKKGEIHPKSKKERTFSRWTLHSRLGKSHELGEHINDVLDQLDQNPGAFRDISEKYDGCMQLVGYFHVDYPGLTFDREMVKRLAGYALKVDFDFYYLCSD